MKIEGVQTIQAERPRVFALLLDEDILRRCLPGVQRLTRQADDRFALTWEVGFGSVRGTYEGNLSLTERAPPDRIQVKVEGQGKLGFVRGRGLLRLEAEESSGTPSTRLVYQGEVQIGGTLAGVGQRMIQAASKVMVGQFFAAIEAEAKAAQSNSAMPVRHGPIRNLLRWLRSILRGLFQRSARSA